MCGIAGILHFDPSTYVDADRLRAMRDVIAHRGPDGEGLMVDGAVGLAHRRLAIIDVALGDQPMSNEDESVWIVFNGEIYNHAELRPWLESRGHRYKTRSDTETILHLYEEKGDAVVDDLHGMFAFAIWDRQRRRLLLARDRLGIKPLYYARTDGVLLFGSEIKSLLASHYVKPSFDAGVLPEFLSTRYLSGDRTFFDGIRKLMPGHVMTWSEDGGVEQRRYWQLPQPTESSDGLSVRALGADLRTRLEASVRSHLMSDVPLGVFLSGGIDSTAIAAMVAKQVDSRIQTFSVGFEDAEANELPYARLAAAHIGSEHRDVTVSPAQFVEALPQLLWHEDEPIAFPSSVPLYFVAKLASEHVKVVLTGEGSDELFLGYNRYRVTSWNARLGAPYWWLAPSSFRASVRKTMTRLPPSIGRFASRTFLALEPGIRALYLENFAVFRADTLSSLLQNAAARTSDPYSITLPYYDDAPGNLVDRLSRGDLQTYLHELLMKQDQMSMAASIESRVPFLDDRLVEHVASLPGRLKLPAWETKVMLRAAVRDLIPQAILTRSKMGFPVPLGRWFRGDYRFVIDEFVLGPRAESRGLFEPAALRQMVAEHAAGTTSHADRLWLLINLEIWNRIFADGEDRADIARALGARPAPTFHANSLGQGGRPVAADERRPHAQPANAVAALPPPPAHAGHDARVR